MLLAMDTSSRRIGVALYDGEQVLHEAVWTSRNHHTVELSPAVQFALRQAGLVMKDIEAVGVAIGPGSYTGLRIGLAVAKGLALACHLPLVGVPTLDILVAAQPVEEVPLAATLEAGRGRLAVGWYQVEEDAWKIKGDPEVLDPEELSRRIRKPTLVCGELTEEALRVLGRKRKNVVIASPARRLRRPAFLAELAWQRWEAEDVDDPATLAPFYLQVGEPIPA